MREIFFFSCFLPHPQDKPQTEEEVPAVIGLDSHTSSSSGLHKKFPSTVDLEKEGSSS